MKSKPHRFASVLIQALALMLATAGLLVLGACSGERATPIDPANPPTEADADSDIPDVQHPLEPTDQMKDAARQQCLDDDTLEAGYVKAVDPESGDIMAEITVDCSQAG